jgi:hypothetical protein
MNMKKGNVQAPSEKQFDELRNCVTRSFNKLRGWMSRADVEKWIGNSKDLDALLAQMLPTEVRERFGGPTYRIISKGYFIPAVDGTDCIGVGDVFLGRIDPIFESATGKPKEKINVDLLDILKCKSFFDILNEYKEDKIDSLAFSRDQILTVIRNTRNFLDTQDFFFLLEADGRIEENISVVHAYMDSGSILLNIKILSLDDFVNLKRGVLKYLFVVPKL